METMHKSNNLEEEEIKKKKEYIQNILTATKTT